MSPEESRHLRHLCTLFGVHALGDGDPVAGANTLAAMACVLANLAPADGTLLSKDGSPLRLGASLLVSGSASVSRVTDEVVSEVGRCQNNLILHLRDYARWMEKAADRPGASPPPAGPGSEKTETLLAMLQGSLPPLGYSRAEGWGELLAISPNESVEDLMLRPKFLVTAARPEDLAKGLTGIRPGRPLVHLGLRCPADLVGFAGVIGALLEGRQTVGGHGETIRGNLLVTDPFRTIGEAARDPDERMAWVSQLLWLSDGGAGPDLAADGADHPAGEETCRRFRVALGRVLASRMNHPLEMPGSVGWELGAARFRWGAFLRETEPRLPGIKGAARNLLASLVYGLGAMLGVEPGAPLDPDGVEALARHLVRRMADTRDAILSRNGSARRRVHIERVFRKLRNGPQDTRSLYRDLSLLAADCEACLKWLEEGGMVRRDGRNWEHVEGTTLAFSSDGLPLPAARIAGKTP
jgi:hypothetical protein